MKKIFIIIVLLSSFIASTIYCMNRNREDNNFSAYTIYNIHGNKVSFKEMLSSLKNAQVCLFGENHNDPISHWIELKLLQELYHEKETNIIFGGEMWETDQQNVMDECVKNKLYDIQLLSKSSLQWPNFSTDYRPLVEFCRDHDIPFVCTNVPRRYATMVSIEGDSVLNLLSQTALSYLPPLPIKFNFAEKSYKECADVAKRGAMASIRKGSVENLVKAQALKDATMAYNINKNYKKNSLFYHINGELHSANHSGIAYYLHLINPELNIKTISVLSLPSTATLTAEERRADFVIVVPEDMTKEY